MLMVMVRWRAGCCLMCEGSLLPVYLLLEGDNGLYYEGENPLPPILYLYSNRVFFKIIDLLLLS